MQRSLLLATGAILWVAGAWANEFDPVVFHGRSDRPDPTSYRVGDLITMELSFAEAPVALTSGNYRVAWTRTGDDGKVEKGKIPLDGRTPCRLTTTMDRPGLVYFTAAVVDGDGKRVQRDRRAPGMPDWETDTKSIAFRGGVLVEPEKLVQAHPEPEDFDAFWARQKARLAAIPARAEVVEVPRTGTVCRVYSVKVACAGPHPVTGFLTVPRNAKARSMPAVCEFQGYGTRIQTAPEDGPDGKLVLNVNAHGYDLGRDKAYYDAVFDAIRTPKSSYAFSRYQNEHPEGCYFNGMALRVMRAFDFMRTLKEWNGTDLEAEGGSQGGLQTMWAVCLVDGLTAARPHIPWCADLGGDAVEGRLVSGWRIAWTEGLSYYDCVNHARRAKCPVAITRAGLGDDCCYASGIAILYNNIPPCFRSLTWVQGSTHGYIPPEPNQSVTLHTP